MLYLYSGAGFPLFASGTGSDFCASGTEDLLFLPQARDFRFLARELPFLPWLQIPQSLWLILSNSSLALSTSIL